MRRMLGLLMILCLALTGCADEENQPEPDSKAESAKITLTPVDPFEGEAAKLKNFLGTMTGGFKLRYEGDGKPNATLNLDLWENGKKVGSFGSIMDVFFDPGDPDNREVEIIMSIDSVPAAAQGGVDSIKVGIVHDSGTGVSTFTRPVDPKLTARGLIHYSEPVTLTATGDVPVWGMHATSTNSIRSGDFTQEALSGMEWGMIATLRFDE
ncbi:hypothetical protein FHS18_004859 [Paenibacillus phyllosphaerae]|uniref:Uncharacterized protein n=1 Tax=Paenibacillus phyllosphaerae TaxID=274593 RepID=A0A7W5B1Y8_9BACL|nr:hypothetical protein [Paenibacillus phyllosphaerae]MBB3112757.1 hypothetical protein [Paenibacillus phyllosphaerae]